MLLIGTNKTYFQGVKNLYFSSNVHNIIIVIVLQEVRRSHQRLSSDFSFYCFIALWVVSVDRAGQRDILLATLFDRDRFGLALFVPVRRTSPVDRTSKLPVPYVAVPFVD